MIARDQRQEAGGVGAGAGAPRRRGDDLRAAAHDPDGAARAAAGAAPRETLGARRRTTAMTALRRVIPGIAAGIVLLLPAALLPAADDAAALRDPQERHLANIRQLTSGGQNAEAYFSADGTRIIFQATRPPYDCDQIFTMNLDGSDVRLVSTGTGRTTCAFFLPDGKRFVYASTHLAGDACSAAARPQPGLHLGALPRVRHLPRLPGRRAARAPHRHARLRRRGRGLPGRQPHRLHLGARRRPRAVHDGDGRRRRASASPTGSASTAAPSTPGTGSASSTAATTWRSRRRSPSTGPCWRRG